MLAFTSQVLEWITWTYMYLKTTYGKHIPHILHPFNISPKISYTHHSNFQLLINSPNSNQNLQIHTHTHNPKKWTSNWKNVFFWFKSNLVILDCSRGLAAISSLFFQFFFFQKSWFWFHTQIELISIWFQFLVLVPVPTIRPNFGGKGWGKQMWVFGIWHPQIIPYGYF
jgi:hypothetical protein